MARKRKKRVNQAKRTTNQAEPRLNQDTEFNRGMLHRIFNNSVMQSRASYGNTQTFGGLRDVYSALGYPAVGKIEYSEYYAKYKRQDIAAAIIDKPVYGSWKKQPVVRSVDQNGDTDLFMDAWDKLATDHRIFDVFQRVDKLAGIGQYAVLYLGVKDGGENQQEPLQKGGELLYLQPYGQDNAPITSAVTDRADRRFAMPAKYGLRSVQIVGGTIDSSKHTQENVDASRVIHIADNILENNVYGIPRLESVYNRLLNLELIVGGSAEMFWQGAFPGMAFSVKEGFELTPQDKTDLDEEIQKYVHQMERYMKLNGLDVENLSASVADPSSHVDVELKMISIAKNIPKRILEGSERGELASSQDTKAWNEYLDNRRRTFCEMIVMRQTIDRFIDLGILPDPPGGYVVEWPDLESTSDKDVAEVGKIRSEALRSYCSNPDAQLTITPDAFFEEIMGLEPEKVKRIMEALNAQFGRVLGSEGDGDEFEKEDMELLNGE